MTWINTINKLTNEELNIVRHDCGRKCDDWSEAVDIIEVPSNLINKLGITDFSSDSVPSDDLPADLDGTIFVARVNDKLYLVNTEGYSYCRYTALVVAVD